MLNAGDAEFGEDGGLMAGRGGTRKGGGFILGSGGGRATLSLFVFFFSRWGWSTFWPRGIDRDGTDAMTLELAREHRAHPLLELTSPPIGPNHFNECIRSSVSCPGGYPDS